MRFLRRSISLLTALSCVLWLAACGVQESPDGGPRVAFVTNGVDPFWTLAAAGVADAAEEFGADADVRMPDGVVDQVRIVEDLLARGIDGIAISPVDGENQTDLINTACEATHVITQDADSPDSKRLCYVGMDNYAAGWDCGELLREALPEGGEVMLFVGRLEQDNARKRRQGFIDAWLGRQPDATRDDAADALLQVGNYTVLDTRTDQFDRARAKANAEDSLARYPDLDAMVGLFAYNTPLCLEALRDADKLGEVELVGFDEAEATLQGIIDGHVHGTVVQQPYRYGYESIRILVALAAGDRSVLPEDGGLVEVPTRVIRKAEVVAFRDEMRALLERGE